MAAAGTDWGGIIITGGVLIGGYFLWTSGALQGLISSIQRPGSPYGGYCSDGSTPNPATGLCMNGTAPTTVPVAQSPYGPTGQPCYGQDMYTGQPCACASPYSTSTLMGGYGQPPTSPTCNCQNCGQMGGYGSPYGAQSPYGAPGYPGQMPYGSPYGTSPYGLPQIGPYGSSPYSTPPYGMPGTGLVSPYGVYPGGGYSPFAATPIIAPVPQVVGVGIGPTFGFGGAPGFGFGGGGGGGGGFGGHGGRGGAFQGTTDLNSYAGRAIAAEGFGF